MDDEWFHVTLRGRKVGSLLRHIDYTRFVFDEEYVVAPDREILGLRFEDNLRARCSANARLPPWFSNLLPEGRLRDWIAAERGVPVAREMELLAQIGHDLPGAVKVNPAPGDAGDVVPREVVPKNGEGGVPESGEPRPLWKFSLAGVGLKFSMLKQGDRFTAPAFGEDGDWIVKLPDPSHHDVPLNELAMMTLAGRVGIEVPEVRLVHRDLLSDLPLHIWPNSEVRAYAIRRFDRGIGRALIHIEDMAQVRGFYPDRKYAGSFNTVAALVYRRRDVSALRELTRRLVFNVLIGNGDAHLKNWSLIYRDPRSPTLAPAYDLISTAVYTEHDERPENLGLKLNGSRRFEDATLASFTYLETKLGVKADLADVGRDLVEAVRRELSIAEDLLAGSSTLRQGIVERIRREVARLLG